MYGRTVLSQNTVFPTRVSADGKPQYKAGGITIDWSLVAAASGDQTLADGSVIKDGQKFLRYGQVLCRVASNGKYAPYDPSGTTGQEVLTNGRAFILDQTVTQYDTGNAGLSAVNDQIGEAIDGGPVWLARIIQSGVASHSLSAGPTLAELITAFPRSQLVRDE
jgi:hypothetical protein